jgi:ABC-2 type transport system permease protein
VQRGDFGRYLIRPVGTLTQHLTNRTNLQTLGDVVGGAGVLAAASAIVPVDWSPLAVLYLVAAIGGGAMTECSLQLLLSSLTFRMLSTRSLRLDFIDNVMNGFGSYPLRIFPPAIRFSLTFGLPLAFVAYFPATVLLHRTGELYVAPWLAAVAPVAGPLLFTIAYKTWYSQLKHYKSSGT